MTRQEIINKLAAILLGLSVCATASSQYERLSKDFFKEDYDPPFLQYQGNHRYLWIGNSFIKSRYFMADTAYMIPNTDCALVVKGDSLLVLGFSIPGKPSDSTSIKRIQEAIIRHKKLKQSKQ